MTTDLMPPEPAASVDPTLPEFDVELTRYPRAEIMPDVRRLSGVSNVKSVFGILFQWGVVALAAWAAVASGHWAVYILAGIIIGSRQQALGVMVHDAAHYLLFTNRTVNDMVSDAFLAFPLGMSTTLYRETHFRHHRFANTDRDPDYVQQQADSDWRWPKTPRDCAKLGLQCILGLNLHRSAKIYTTWSPSANLFKPLSPAYPLRARILWVATTPLVFVALYFTNGWIPAILLWVVPSLTWLNVVTRIRATAEHILAPSTHELNSTRTVIPTLFEKWFIAPLGINYHLEHHLFPSVPGRNLAELHRLLIQDEDYRAKAHITHSYLGPKRGLLGELLTKRGE
jgi:fatty acid desaturase